ncbi:MAG: hypothetical protein HY318_09925 [Armatimonadetes bacterium]|nr:hypothetical protein [Armatimonadota bacterium]
MSRTRIEIEYPREKMEANRRRLEAMNRFEYVDRPPVVFGLCQRYFVDNLGIGWDAFFDNPRDQIYYQLMSQKLAIEWDLDDRCAAPGVWVMPGFENITNASGAGCEIAWSNDETPRALPFMAEPEEVVRYQPRDHTSGLWGKRLKWYHEMLELRNEFQVIFNGEEIPVSVGLAINGDSPFMTVLDVTDYNWLAWCKECPDIAHLLMQKLTDSFIQVESHFRTVAGNPLDGGFGMSDDPVPMLSLETYREFVVPYTKRLYDTFGPVGKSRGMHLCGKNTHVIDALVDDLQITSMDGYGHVNPPEAYVERMAGKIQLRGNLDPMRLLTGPISDIRAETVHLLDVLGKFGGILVQDGMNICPGTPLEHMLAVREVCEEYGVPESAQRK